MFWLGMEESETRNKLLLNSHGFTYRYKVIARVRRGSGVIKSGYAGWMGKQVTFPQLIWIVGYAESLSDVRGDWLYSSW